MKRIHHLQRFYTIGYLLLVPWFLWALAVGNSCITDCSPTPYETFVNRFYYSYAIIPFGCHFISKRLWSGDQKNWAKYLAVIPIIALPIYIGMFIQVNWLIIFIQPKNFGAALTGEIPQPKAKIA